MNRYVSVLLIPAVVTLVAVAVAAPAGAVVAPGGVEWSQRYDGPRGKRDGANAVAVSPDGTTAVAAGFSTGVHGTDAATVAYNAATGAPKWTKRFNGSGDGNDQVRSVAVSPDGTKVAVTGQSWSEPAQYDY